MSDIVERLRRWAISTDAVPASDLMDEAADEIARLRLADAEREAIGKAAVAYASREKDGVGLLDDGPVECGQIAATLRKLLDRLA